MPQQIRETSTITEAAAAEAKRSGRMLIQHISPGWGSSGYYSTEVLEQVVADKVIPAGTHMYADHPTDLEAMERPVRSIKDLMAVTVEDGRLATQADVAAWGADLGAAVSEVQVVPQYQEFLETVKDAIGTSVRGAGSATEGVAEGRSGLIFESIAAPVLSVDFVTRAGRGGKVLQVLESAKATTRAIAHGISEATANDIRDGLSVVLRDAYGGEKTYVWVRDFDDTTVWFEVEAPDDAGIFAQPYSETDGAVDLTGERTEVRVVTQFVPVNPAGPTPTKESKEDTMATTQIEEAEKQRLVDEAGRVPTLESERDAEKARADKAEAELAEEHRQKRTAKASTIIAEQAATAEVQFTPAEVVDFVSDLPLKEQALDEEAFTKTVSEAAAKKLEEAGAGKVVGMGGKPVEEAGGRVTWDDIDSHLGIVKEA